MRGLAVSAVAAGVLGFEAAIASETIAKFLFEHDRPEGPSERWRLRQGEVVVWTKRPWWPALIWPG